MDKRFLIYEGFSLEADYIFKSLISKFNFKILYLTDSGIKLENSKIILEIFYETGFQIQIRKKSVQSSELLYYFIKRRNDKELLETFFEILNYSRIKPQEGLSMLSDFLIDNFFNDLSE